jgi:site-specific DNA recombinase
MKQVKEQSSNGADHKRYAAVYARVSTEDQGKGFSIPTQIESCQKLAAHEGYTVPDTHVLIDEGISGTTMDRPGLRQLRDLVNTKAITAIGVHDPDRLSRNLGHQLLLAEKFERAAVKLLIVSHPMEQGPEGWLFFQMRGALAEYERAKLMERTRRRRIGRAQAGNPWGGQVPLGYRAVREPHQARWEIDEDEAAVVRRIFAMCLSGMSTYAIALQLSQERILTRGSGRRVLKPGIWQASSVHRILTNEAYAGQTYFGKYESTSKTTRRLRPREEWIAIQVPPILDEVTFHATQHQLQRNRELSPRNKKREYLLSGGLLRCGRCGRAMTGGAYRDTRRYRCSSLGQVLDPEARCYGQLLADEAEAKAWAVVDELLQYPERVVAGVAQEREQAAERDTESIREMSLVDDALAKCDREEKRWAQAYADEVINVAELRGYRAEIGARRQSLLGHRQALERQRETIWHTLKDMESLITYCERLRQEYQTLDAQEKRRVFNALGLRVTWTPGQPLAFHAKIPLGEGKVVPIAS